MFSVGVCVCMCDLLIFLQGRESELHDQLGALVRLGAEKNIPLPTFEAVYSALSVVEAASARAREQAAAAAAVPRRVGGKGTHALAVLAFAAAATLVVRRIYA